MVLVTVQERVTQLGSPVDDMSSEACSIDVTAFAKRLEMIRDVSGGTSKKPGEPGRVHRILEYLEYVSAR